MDSTEFGKKCRPYDRKKDLSEYLKKRKRYEGNQERYD